MIDTRSKIFIENTVDRTKNGWLDLPFTEDQLEEFLERIGVTQDDDNAEDDYERLMAGEVPKPKWEVTDQESDYLADEQFEDIYEASDLVERIEALKDWQSEILNALIEDGSTLEEAIEIVEDGDFVFYPKTDLTKLAREFVDEGLFTKEYLLNFIDYDALGSALADDGYTEANGGVLRRP